MENRFLSRGKRIDNGEWVEGCYVLIDNHCYIYTGSLCNGGLYVVAERFEIQIDTLCQCTGLKDKNGKLIWENDVCDRKEEYPEIVKYNKGDWTLDYSYSKDRESGYCYCNLGFYVLERKCVEVIGNVFDNPELLEV